MRTIKSPLGNWVAVEVKKGEWVIKRKEDAHVKNADYSQFNNTVIFPFAGSSFSPAMLVDLAKLTEALYNI